MKTEESSGWKGGTGGRKEGEDGGKEKGVEGGKEGEDGGKEREGGKKGENGEGSATRDCRMKLRIGVVLLQSRVKQ